MVAIRRLSIAAVKATRLREVDQLRLDRRGVRENRRFFLINELDEMVNAKRLGQLQTALAEYSEEDRTLTVELPDGRVLQESVVVGPAVQTRFYGDTLPGHLVEGPWSDAFSELAGQPLRLVEAGEEGAVDRGDQGTVTLISRASLDRLAREGALDGLDARRFRMLIEVDGLEAHGEDLWVGRSARIGGAVVRFGGNVGRCVITSRHPETGEADVPTLKFLGRYRQEVESTEPLPFGIYGRVLEPGVVRVGDPVALEG